MLPCSREAPRQHFLNLLPLPYGHGMPRTTQDLDVVLDPPSPEALDALVRSLPPDEYYVDPDAARDALRRRSMFNVVDFASGWKVDFISERTARPVATSSRDV